MKINFVGPSYVYTSINFDNQRSINLFPVKSETGTSKDQFMLCPTPGRAIFCDLSSAPIRGEYNTIDRAFVVSYDTLYELFSDGTSVVRGTLETFSGNVSMVDNGLELIIVDGTPTGGWILTLDTNDYDQIVDEGFEGATTVTFVSGYFLINRPNSGIYQISEPYDGMTWDPTMFANAEGSPDNLVAVVTVHQQTFLIGGNTIQVVVNTGASPFPFENVQGVFIEYGATAAFGVQQIANTIFWAGNDKSGANVIWMAEGYQPRRISTTAIENYLSQYDITNATSYSYQENGHYFYIISIPNAPTSLVYDITMEQWHERAVWNPASGFFERDRANFHMYIFGKHLVSDYENGKIYEQSVNYNDDAGTLIKRTRTLPYFTDDLEFLYFQYFQIDMQTGVGLGYDANPENMDPHITLRWSSDGGHTWSTEISRPIGKVGEYSTRARWDMLGRSRFRIWEVSIIANVPVNMIAAHQGVIKGNA